MSIMLQRLFEFWMVYRHIDTHIKKQNEPFCANCGRYFTEFDRLKAHNCPKYICNICFNKFVNMTNLERHTNIYHLKIIQEQKYLCEYCGKGYSVKKSLYRHCKIKHVPLINEPQKETYIKMEPEEIYL